MDFSLSDDQQAMLDEIRRFCDNEIAPKAEQRDHEGGYENGLIEKLGEMGLFGVYVPEEYGGAGLDVVSYVAMVEELSRACGATGIQMSAHHSLCVDPILNFGSEEQKQKYLPKLSSGEWIGCFLAHRAGQRFGRRRRTLHGGRAGRRLAHHRHEEFRHQRRRGARGRALRGHRSGRPQAAHVGVHRREGHARLRTGQIREEDGHSGQFDDRADLSKIA